MSKKKRYNNSSEDTQYEKAKELARKFHGRENQGDEEIIEEEEYSDDVALLGFLEMLEVDNGEEILELTFEVEDTLEANEENEEVIRVCQDPENDTIVFVGGSQEVPDDILTGYESGKNKVTLGDVVAISYFSDKHHLEGPKKQSTGVLYRHEFGEEGGRVPTLVYDKRNKTLELVGGDYEIREEGIWN